MSDVKSEERFRLLFEDAPIGIIQIDQKGKLISANQGFTKIFGYSPEEAVGLTPIDVAPPEEKADAMEPLEKLLSGAIEIADLERRLLRKDGSAVWVRITAKFMPDERGTVQWGIVVFQDISLRKRAEEVRSQNERNQTFLLRLSDMIRPLTEPDVIATTVTRMVADYFNVDRCFISRISRDEGKAWIEHEARKPGLLSVEGEVNLADLPEVMRKAEIETLIFRDVPADPELSARDKAALARLQFGAFIAAVLRKGARNYIWVLVLATEEPRNWYPTDAPMLEEIAERTWSAIERVRTETALRQSEEKFRATFENAPLGIAECTIDGRFADVNSKLVELLGYTKEEIARLTITDLTHPNDLERSLSRQQRLVAGEISSEVMEKRYIRKDRSFVWVNTTAAVASIHGKARYMIMAVEVITARKKAEEDLKIAIESSHYDANHDMLTGLANRASFKDRLMEALAYARRDEHLVALHFLDLDRFKLINDTLGHEVGDILLKLVAKRIKSHLRSTDLAARLGGDEFVVLQTHLAEPAAAGILAAKLAGHLGRQYYVVKDQRVESGTSIGIALYPSDAEDAETLMNRADLALYDAKQRGRGNYQFYRQELGDAYRETQKREQELVRALREHELCLHYQPQFDVNSGRITGIEALLRWCHPERGQLAAAEFIREAERARLMVPIGEWVLQTACRQYKEWVNSGFNVPLTLNLSSMQLQDPRLLEALQRILQEAGLPATMLQLEMREAVLGDSKFSKSLLKEMKATGLRLSLDNFGSEMTALPILDRFPFDVVKPSQGLVRALPSGKRESTILTAIVSVAHDLRVAVSADGVETASQLTSVKEHGCDSVQGYFLSSPLSSDAMKRRIDLELVH